MAYISKISIRGTTYDIKSVFDGDMAKNFADEYNSAATSAYEVGDLVVYEGKLYECHTATANPPGAFDSSKWDETNVENEFKRIQTAKTDPTASGTATAFIDTISQNDQGVLTATKKNLPWSSSVPAADATSGSAGSSNTIARGDHVHPKGLATLADTATALATARYIDGVSFNGGADIAHYGECSSGAGDATKVAICTGFALKDGARIIVKFISGNTNLSSTLQLNINSTGAKNIKYKGTNATSANLPIAPNAVYEFIYDLSDDCYHFVGNATIDASFITSGTLPVARGGTGSNSFDGDSIIISNTAGNALVAYDDTTYAVDHPIYIENLQALDGAGTVPGSLTMVPLQQQINAITGGGYDHIRFAIQDAAGNACPAYITNGSGGFTCNFQSPANIYGGYALSVDDLIVGRDGTLGKVSSVTTQDSVTTAVATYLGILFGINAWMGTGTASETLYIAQNDKNGTHWVA